MKFVWPDSFVEEGNLNRDVSTLRKALDERPCDHRYIETIPKTGYRFVAPVRTREYQPPAGDVPKAAGAPMRHIVGRETDRAVLRQAYDRAQQGHGGIVCVSGDAGLGKSALAGVFLEDLVQDGQTFHLAHGRCSEPLTESEPFMPWIEALSGLANESAVSDTIQKTAPTWHKEISHTSAGAPAMMKRELLDFCRQISTVHPLVIFIDDFHWADLGSADLIAFLAT